MRIPSIVGIAPDAKQRRTMFSARNPVIVHANQAAGREHAKAINVSNQISQSAISFQIESGSQESRNLRDFILSQTLASARARETTVCNRQSKIEIGQSAIRNLKSEIVCPRSSTART